MYAYVCLTKWIINIKILDIAVQINLHAIISCEKFYKHIYIHMSEYVYIGLCISWFQKCFVLVKSQALMKMDRPTIVQLVKIVKNLLQKDGGSNVATFRALRVYYSSNW